jgi:hypothetical protein
MPARQTLKVAAVLSCCRTVEEAQAGVALRHWLNHRYPGRPMLM